MGTYSFAFSLYMLLSTFCLFGLRSSTTKYTGQFLQSTVARSASIKAAMAVATTASLLITGMIFLCSQAGWGGQNLLDSTNIFLALPFRALNEVMLGYINGLRQMKHFGVIRALRWILIIAFLSLNIILGNPVGIGLFSFFLAELIILVYFVCAYRTELFGSHSKIGSWIGEHLKFGSKIFLTDAVNQLNTRLPIILLGVFLTKSDVGIFSFAATIAAGLLMIPGTVALNFNPIIANLWQRDKRQLRQYIDRVRKWTMIATLPLFGMSTLIYPLLIRYVMKGDDYNNSIPVFYIIIAGQISITLMNWASGLLAMTGYPGEKLKARSVILGCNMLMCIVLIRLYGVLGAAVATTIANIMWAFAISALIRKKLGINLLRHSKHDQSV